ncbi:MAG: hypothetical protein OXB92_16760 [Acidimicrobiaceae bacterium]|nr:hypothetical protein [Acidimicrobiaceae bacterium]
MDVFDLSALAVGPRLEVAYVLQCRHDDRTVRVPPSTVRHLVALLADSDAGSLLDRPLKDWLDEVRSHRRKHPSPVIGFIGYAYRHLSDLGGIDIEAEYASDIWVASRLGIKVTRSPAQTRFDAIDALWLRAAVKRWARLRLGSGKTYRSVHVDVRAMLWFSRFLTRRDPRAVDETVVTRDALESYLVWVTGSHLAAHIRHLHHLSARLSRCLPTPRLATPTDRDRRDLSRRPAQPTPAPTPVHRRVRHGTTRKPRTPRDAARRHDPGAGHRDHGDRPAGQRRLLAAVQPDHRPQRRMALPSLLQHQDGD